jgi:hypothetical protein
MNKLIKINCNKDEGSVMQGGFCIYIRTQNLPIALKDCSALNHNTTCISSIKFKISVPVSQ